MLKRSFDILFSILGLAIVFPLIIVIAVLVKTDSKGPVFYRPIRTGRYGRPFRQFKFRTMIENAENLGGSTTAENDPRITKTGKFLRKNKLDEIPQLINILKGDMSFVGPRPELQEHTNCYTEEEKIILTVRPGLTDYASLKFIGLDKEVGKRDADEAYIKKVRPEKNRLRIMYVKNQSFSEDMRIILITLSAVIKRIWNTKN